MKHKNLQETLDACRKNGNPHETTRVLEKLLDHNFELRMKQHKNSTSSWKGDFIDDRYENLKPIF